MSDLIFPESYEVKPPKRTGWSFFLFIIIVIFVGGAVIDQYVRNWIGWGHPVDKQLHEYTSLSKEDYDGLSQRWTNEEIAFCLDVSQDILSRWGSLICSHKAEKRLVYLETAIVLWKGPMKECLRHCWAWLADEDNRGRVTLIVAVAAGIIIPLLVLLIKREVPPPPGGEVRLSVEDFQAVLEKREREVEQRLAQAHGDERSLLENELTEVKRQLSDIETAHADALRQIRELKTDLARLGDDVSGKQRAQIRAAIETGDFSKADALLAEIEDRTDVAVVRAAEAAFQRGQIAAIQIKWGEAATHFDKAARLNPTYDHLNAAGIFAERAAQYKTALRHFEELLKLSHREHGERSPETARVLNCLAGVLQATGQYAEAEALLRHTLEIVRTTLGGEHPDYALSLNNLAVVLWATGQHTEAEALSQHALEIVRTTLGGEHPDYALSLNNLASVLQATGQYAEAEALYRHALEIVRTTLGGEHPDYALSLNNLASVLQAMGQYAEAEALYRHALEIRRTTLGGEHPDYALSLNNLASVLEATGQYTEAEALCRHALEIHRTTLGGEHPHYTTSLNNLASVLEATGQYTEAEALYRHALEIRRTTLGEEHPSTRRLAGNYRRLLRAQFPDNPVLAELDAVFGGEHQ